jgi:acetyl-CoA carboxylase biotin carboxyl carrier protein
MTLEEIESLVRAAELRGIAEFHCSDERSSLTLKLSRGPSDDVVAPSSADAKVTVIRAPNTGVLRLAHPSMKERWASEGARVQKSAIVAFLEVGPCLRPITALNDCVVGRALAQDGRLVGYGDPLFEYTAVAD